MGKSAQNQKLPTTTKVAIGTFQLRLGLGKVLGSFRYGQC